MSEWKELAKDYLPNDWFVGDYEIRQIPGYECKTDLMTRLQILKDILISTERYEYRKPEPLPTTNEEITGHLFYTNYGVEMCLGFRDLKKNYREYYFPISGYLNMNKVSKLPPYISSSNILPAKL